MRVIPLLRNFFRHKEKPEISVENTVVFSTCCVHTDYSCCYCFSLVKNSNGWLFSFDCGTTQADTRIRREDIPVKTAEVTEILDTVRRQGLIGRVRYYRKPKTEFTVTDETIYGTTFRFADGSQVSAPICAGSDITSIFFRLAGKYGDGE